MKAESQAVLVFSCPGYTVKYDWTSGVLFCRFVEGAKVTVENVIGPSEKAILKFIRKNKLKKKLLVISYQAPGVQVEPAVFFHSLFSPLAALIHCTAIIGSIDVGVDSRMAQRGEELLSNILGLRRFHDEKSAIAWLSGQEPRDFDPNRILGLGAGSMEVFLQTWLGRICVVVGFMASTVGWAFDLGIDLRFKVPLLAIGGLHLLAMRAFGYRPVQGFLCFAALVALEAVGSIRLGVVQMESFPSLFLIPMAAIIATSGVWTGLTIAAAFIGVATLDFFPWISGQYSVQILQGAVSRNLVSHLGMFSGIFLLQYFVRQLKKRETEVLRDDQEAENQAIGQIVIRMSQLMNGAALTDLPDSAAIVHARSPYVLSLQKMLEQIAVKYRSTIERTVAFETALSRMLAPVVILDSDSQVAVISEGAKAICGDTKELSAELLQILSQAEKEKNAFFNSSGKLYEVKFDRPVVQFIEKSSPSMPQFRPQVSEKPRILIIDDETDLARVLSDVLSHFFETHVVSSVDEAVALDQGYIFDLVLTDLRMPRTTPQRLMISLQKRFAGVPILVMTGHPSDHPDVLSVLAQGAVRVLSKPLPSSKELAALLKEALVTGRHEDSRIA